MRKFIYYLICNYFILLVILLSNTVYFGLKYNQLTIFILFISSMLLFILGNKTYNLKNFIVLLSCLTILSANSLIHFYSIDSGAISAIIAMFMKLFSIGLIATNITDEDFKIGYVNVIFLLSIISLIFFWGNNIFPGFFYKYHNLVIAKDHHYIAAPLQTWGSDIIYNRNAGMFWEAGAFQAFLNLALILLIELKKSKLNIIKLIIISITIITTYSTTGYIIFILLIFYYIIGNVKNVKSFKASIFSLMFLTFSFIIFNYLQQTQIIQNKFSYNNLSYLIRMNDFWGSIDLIKESPILGQGFFTLAGTKYGIHDNSNGLLYFAYSFGVPILILYLFMLYKGLSRLINNISPSIVFLVFLILYFTESLIVLPVFLCFIFKWKAKSEGFN